MRFCGIGKLPRGQAKSVFCSAVGEGEGILCLCGDSGKMIVVPDVRFENKRSVAGDVDALLGQRYGDRGLSKLCRAAAEVGELHFFTRNAIPVRVGEIQSCQNPRARVAVAVDDRKRFVDRFV